MLVIVIVPAVAPAIPPNEVEVAPPVVVPVVVDKVVEELAVYKAERRSFPKPDRIEKTTGIPMLGRIAAGQPIWAEENMEEYVPIELHTLPRRIKIENLFALRVVGDSMINANILNGDIVAFEKIFSVHEQINNGDIAAVLIDDKATLKRVFFVKNGLKLKSENPEVEPIFLNENDFVLIQGKLVKVLGKED